MTFIPKALITRRTYERILGVALAFLLSLLALLITQTFRAILSDTSFAFFIMAVVISAWVGGFLAGMIASIISIFLHDIYIIEPIGQLMSLPGDLLRLSVLLAVTLLISALEAGRRSAIDKAHDKLEEMRVMVASLADGVTAQLPDGQPVFANAAATTLLGYPDVQTFINTPIAELRSTVKMYDEQRAPLPLSAYSRARVLAEKKPVSVNMLLVSNETGEEKWINVHSAPVFDDDGEIRLVVNIFRDVSERKQREAELLRLAQQLSMQKARLDNVIRNVPGVIWDGLGAPGKQTIDYVSPYAERMSGYALAEWMEGSAFFERVIPPSDYPQVLEDTRKVFESGQPGTVQFRMIAANGNMLYLEAHTSMIFGPDGAGIGACGVIMDISARKLAELELQATAEALRHSNRELEQFAYVASHDLQEPLRMVTSYLQLLEQNLRGQLNEDAEEYLGFAVDGAVRMKKLIGDLLAYSRVGRSQVVLTDVDMNAAIEEVLHTLSVRIEECGAQVTVDPLPTVRGDEGQLTQLLQNLIGNAVKFCADDPRIHIGVTRSELEYTFFVRDNGIGIDPQFFDRIFIIFQRLHSVREYEGTGIGLAICKKIVQRHGGRIWVESQPQQGATFYFTLPHFEGLTSGGASGASEAKGLT